MKFKQRVSIKICTGFLFFLVNFMHGMEIDSSKSEAVENTKKEKKIFGAGAERILKGHTGLVFGVAYNPHKEGELASCSDDTTVIIWDLRSGNEKNVLKEDTNSNFFLGDTDLVRQVAYNAHKEGELASCSDDKTVIIWDIETGNQKNVLKGHTGWVVGVAYNPHKEELASGSHDKTVRLWDTETGKQKNVLKGHTDLVTGVAYSKEGELASCSIDKTVRLWDLRTGKVKNVLKGHTDLVTGAAYSPHKEELASCSWDKTVRLWDLRTGKEKNVLEGHTNSVMGVAYNPHKEELASCSWDKTVRLWNLFRE